MLAFGDRVPCSRWDSELVALAMALVAELAVSPETVIETFVADQLSAPGVFAGQRSVSPMNDLAAMPEVSVAD